MSIFEVHIEASSFLAAQRRALQARRICPPRPLLVAGRSVRLQRVLFGGNALRHHEPATFGVFYDNGRPDLVPTPHPATGFETQLAQDVELLVADDAEIMSLPNGVAGVVSLG